MERCCKAHRPASVRRVITTAETLHNTKRQRGGGGGERITGNGGKKGGNWEKFILKETTTNSYYSSRPSTILLSRRAHHECLLLFLTEVSQPLRLFDAWWWSSLPSTIAKHRDMTFSGATIILTNVPLCLFVSFPCLSLFLSSLPAVSKDNHFSGIVNLTHRSLPLKVVSGYGKWPNTHFLWEYWMTAKSFDAIEQHIQLKVIN